jgi:hypothetical protein
LLNLTGPGLWRYSVTDRAIAKNILSFSLWINPKKEEAEPLQSMYIKHCSYTLQGCRLGKRLKDYPMYLSEEIMSQFGIGFNDTSQKGYFSLEEQYLSS